MDYDNMRSLEDRIIGLEATVDRLIDRIYDLELLVGQVDDRVWEWERA